MQNCGHGVGSLFSFSPLVALVGHPHTGFPSFPMMQISQIGGVTRLSIPRPERVLEEGIGSARVTRFSRVVRRGKGDGGGGSYAIGV